VDREDDVNWGQRIILVVAGLFLLLFAFITMDSYDSDGWLASFLFLAAVVTFYLAARSPRTLS
jgi:hypothetical protein